MNLLSLGKYTFGALISGLAISDVIEHKMKNQNTVIEPPVDSVSIIMPVYNEANFIERAASSIRQQNIIQAFPEYFEFIVVDNGSTDNTKKLAEQFADKVVIQNVRGKLNARNYGISLSNGNIIVAVDGDTYYPPNWLGSLLKPFRKENNINVVAVVGSTFDPNSPIPNQAFTLINFVDKYVVHPTKITGVNSAFWKHLYYMVGKFNEDINQLDVKIVQQEEEYDFGRKLSKFGNVVHQLSASCVHLGGERGACRSGLINDPQICDRYKIGIERFG